MTAITSLGLLLLIGTQAAVGVPVSSVQRINSPSVEENTLVQEEANTVQLKTLSDYGRKYNLENVKNTTQAIQDLVNKMVVGDEANFLRTRLGNEQFQDMQTTLNNTLSETEWMKREAEYLNGKRLQPHVILLRRLIKRFSNAYSRIADVFKDISAGLRTASVGSTGFSDGLQIVIIQVSYDLSAWWFEKVSEEADRDWRSLASLEPV